MKNNIQQLNPRDISSEVFIIAPSQIETISKQFGDAMAVAMNVRPLAHKIQLIAADILKQTLSSAKTMGETKKDIEF
jgi:hypothetical protein